MVQQAITHFGYLEEVLGLRAAINPTYFESCVKVMEDYEKSEGRWWLSHDEVELTIHQLNESFLLIPFDILKSTIKKVLGRQVEDEEISISNDALIAEFKEKVKTYSSSAIYA